MFITIKRHYEKMKELEKRLKENLEKCLRERFDQDMKKTHALVALHEKDRENLIKELEVKEHKLSMATEKKIAELEADFAKQQLAYESKLAKEYNKKESELLEGNFSKLSDSLEELHSKGNATTKLVQELALKAMDNRQLPAPRD